MHRVPIKDLKHLEKAIEVLTRVGGTYHGVAREDRALLVTDAQYRALVDANLAISENGAKVRSRGTNSQKSA